MGSEKQRRGGGRRWRSRINRAALAALAVAGLLAVSPAPAGALPAGTASATAGRVAISSGVVQNEDRQLNTAMLAGVIGLGMIVGGPLACRARISRHRRVRRFRSDLAGNDVMGWFEQPYWDGDARQT